MKPYIPRSLQSLHGGDSDRRVEFCERFLAKLRENENFLTKGWWSDEATFKLNGHINHHNCVYWRDVNPNVILEKDVNLPGVTVWVAISVTGITYMSYKQNFGLELNMKLEFTSSRTVHHHIMRCLSENSWTCISKGDG
jgi:hypothetical protein